MGEVLLRHAQLRRAEVGAEFETPSGRSFRFLVFGEIVSARAFDAGGANAFVHYFVNLPVGWSVSEQTTRADLSGKKTRHATRGGPRRISPDFLNSQA